MKYTDVAGLFKNAGSIADARLQGMTARQNARTATGKARAGSSIRADFAAPNQQTPVRPASKPVTTATPSTVAPTGKVKMKNSAGKVVTVPRTQFTAADDWKLQGMGQIPGNKTVVAPRPKQQNQSPQRPIRTKPIKTTLSTGPGSRMRI